MIFHLEIYLSTLNAKMPNFSVLLFLVLHDKVSLLHAKYCTENTQKSRKFQLFNYTINQYTVKPPYNMISGERWKITLYQVSCYTKVLPILYPYQWKTKVSATIKHLIRNRNKRDDLRVRRWQLSIDNGQLSNLRVSKAALALSVLGLFFKKNLATVSRH